MRIFLFVLWFIAMAVLSMIQSAFYDMGQDKIGGWLSLALIVNIILFVFALFKPRKKTTFAVGSNQ